MKITMQTSSNPKQIFESLKGEVDLYEDRFAAYYTTAAPNVVYLEDESFNSCRATVTLHDWGLEIITAWSGFRYELSLSGVLTYKGAYMGFLEQQLLPDFEYTASQLLEAEVDSSLDTKGYGLDLGAYALNFREPFVWFKREKLNWNCNAHPFAVVLAFVDQHSYTTSWNAIGGGEIVCEVYADALGGQLYLGEFHGSNGTRKEEWKQDWSTVDRKTVFGAFSTMMEAGVFNPPKEEEDDITFEPRKRGRRPRKLQTMWDYWEYKLYDHLSTDVARLGHGVSFGYSTSTEALYITLTRHTDGNSDVWEYRFCLYTNTWYRESKTWKGEFEWKECKKPPYELYLKKGGVIFNDMEMICLMHKGDRKTLEAMVSGAVWVVDDI